jgi:Big-like domain-containing protein/List-Bact-rpt repeat protein
VLWTNGVPQILPMPSGYVYQARLETYKVNDSGTVIGTVADAANTSVSHIVVWNNGIPSILPDAPIPGSCVGPGCTCSTSGSSVSRGINSAGHILGGTVYPPYPPGGISCSGEWVYDGATFRILPFPEPPGCAPGTAGYGPGWFALNDQDEVLEPIRTCSAYDPAVIEPDGSYSFLPLGNIALPGAYPTSINNLGDVLGFYTAPTHLVVWNAAGIHDLGPSGYGYMNNLSQVVYLDSSSHIEIWQNDISTPIPIPAPLVGPTPFGFNDAGQIAVVASVSGAPGVGAYLLTPATIPITVDTSPSGLTIIVDGVSATAPQTFQWAPSSQHQVSATDPQQVTAGSRLAFLSWSDGEALTHTVTTPSTPAAYTATFKTQYLLTTVANPPAGGSITPGGWLDSGSSVTITAAAAAGYGFTGFSGDLSGTTNPNSVTMDGARTVTANFKGLTTTSLSTSPNPNTFGQAVTMTATVAASVGTPGGNVAFYDGATNIGNQPLDGSGHATSSMLFTAGSHTLTASYAGNGSFLTSTSAPVTQTVNKASSSTSVSSSLNPSGAGQTITFTAVVSSLVAVPTGTVTIKDGGAVLGTGTLNGSGQATFSTTNLTAGTHSIMADYNGDTNFLASSSSPLSQTVNAASTTTTLISAPNPSLVGQPVTFTATVGSSTGGIATGTVRFQEGKTVLGSSALNAQGKAIFITSSLSTGSHNIKAVYAGTSSYGGSTSANIKQVVNLAPTTTSLTSSPNPSAVGQNITFTATVTVTGPGTPTGTVTFKDGGKSLGTATLSAGQAAFSTSSLKKGSHSITAQYSGDSNFAGSASPAYTQVVN